MATRKGTREAIALLRKHDTAEADRLTKLIEIADKLKSGKNPEVKALEDAMAKSPSAEVKAVLQKRIGEIETADMTFEEGLKEGLPLLTKSPGDFLAKAYGKEVGDQVHALLVKFGERGNDKE